MWLLLLSVTACDLETKSDSDRDGDGYAAPADCDDDDPAIYPGAADACDGIDNDCSGLPDDRPADGVLRYDDADADGAGAEGTGTLRCPDDEGYAANDDDCDDNRPEVNPGAEERCNGIDDDCDGETDQGAVDSVPVYADNDGDGFGDALRGQRCGPDEAEAVQAGDCDDTDATIHPEAADACDDADNDCDGLIDEDVAVVEWYTDADGDGQGDPASPVSACAAPEGAAANSDDCQDQDPGIYLGAPEACDGVDTDCDGLGDAADPDAEAAFDWFLDGDGDGFGSGAPTARCTATGSEVLLDGDCDEASSGVNPGATERCDEADIDEDCDGLVDDDDPGVTGLLDGFIDGDGDGFGAGPPSAGCDVAAGHVLLDGDCDDTDARVSPAEAESCSGVDDDCDGLIDADDPSVIGLLDWYADADGDSWGAAGARADCYADSGEVGLSGDCDDSDASISPAGVEVCTPAGVDEDCDGLSDDADPGVTGGTDWYADLDGDNDGAGVATRTCVAPAGWVATDADCDDTDGMISTTGAELCDGVDQDCDGTADNGVPNDGAGCVEPAAPVWDDSVEIVHVTVRTHPDTFNGTDDAAYVYLTASDGLHLNNEDWNDNEPGALDEFIFEGESLSKSTFDRMELRLSGGTDRWEPACVAVSVDGEPYYCEDSLTVAMGDNTGEQLTWRDAVSLTCDGCYGTPLSHGPMVGATGADYTHLWYRTDATRRVAIYLADSTAALATAAPVHVSWPTPESDFTDTVRIGGLQPETTWYYEIEVEGTRYGPWSFRTLPDDAGQMRVAFGSCSKDDTQPIFDLIDSFDPDLFLFVGDNHYGNTDDLHSNRQNYREMLLIPERLALVQTTPILATWDDHDYVGNNTDGSDAGKAEALQAFSEYWANGSYGTAATEGVFSSHEVGDVLVVLLDDRYWRGLDDSILGDEQEAWLVETLQASDATFKLLVSGSQFSSQGTSDSWAAFPDAQERLLQLLADESIPGVVTLSGDVHRSEFRLLPGASGGYDVPELTSSPLANSVSACSSDTDVVDCYDGGPSFVLLDIDTTLADPTVTATIYDDTGGVQATWLISLSDLQ